MAIVLTMTVHPVGRSPGCDRVQVGTAILAAWMLCAPIPESSATGNDMNTEVTMSLAATGRIFGQSGPFRIWADA